MQFTKLDRGEDIAPRTPLNVLSARGDDHARVTNVRLGKTARCRAPWARRLPVGPSRPRASRWCSRASGRDAERLVDRRAQRVAITLPLALADGFQPSVSVRRKATMSSISR